MSLGDDELSRLLSLDEGAGPASAIAEARAAAMVEAALSGAGFAPPASVKTDARRRMRSRRPLWLSLGGVLVAGLAAAAYLGTRGGDRTDHPASVAPPGPPLPPPVDAPADAPAVAAPVPPAAAEPAEPVRPGPRPARKEVEEWLARANALRGQKRWTAADALYTRVARAAPRTAAAHVALVASGTLHLEHLGDPAGARQRFRAALSARQNGAVAEEARFGLAEAARRTGNTRAEAAALRELVRKHPGSPLVPRADKRLREITQTR